MGKSTDSETLDISCEYLLTCYLIRFYSINCLLIFIAPSTVGPKFILKPESVEAGIGDTVHLACLVSGNPQPEVVWLNENADTVSFLLYDVLSDL